MDEADASIPRFLIANGANVNARSKDGETALKLAKKYGRKDIVDLLISSGAKD